MVLVDTNILSTFAKIDEVEGLQELLGRMEVSPNVPEEAKKASHLPDSFGRGERDSLAMSEQRGIALATNERRIINYCTRRSIPCLWLDVVLRALWKKEILTRDEVENVIKEIEKKDRIVITGKEEILRR